jgi:hypothetical protein
LPERQSQSTLDNLVKLQIARKTESIHSGQSGETSDCQKDRVSLLWTVW